MTDYHRHMVNLYYAGLLRRYGIAPLLRSIPRLRRIVWTSAGLDMVCAHVFTNMESWT